MNRFALAGLLLLATFPLALSHSPRGTPKNYCEDPSEWNVHEYWPVASGNVMLPAGDGNLIATCSSGGTAGEFDGHSEGGYGGGLLHVTSGDYVTSGSVACYGEVGHHPALGPISVRDALAGYYQPFWVAADTVNLVPPTDPSAPNCGDYQSDHIAACTGTCYVPFDVGLDGTYQVYVGNLSGNAPGVMGHITSP